MSGEDGNLTYVRTYKRKIHKIRKGVCLSGEIAGLIWLGLCKVSAQEN